jgi:hypothetical protein
MRSGPGAAAIAAALFLSAAGGAGCRTAAAAGEGEPLAQGRVIVGEAGPGVERVPSRPAATAAEAEAAADEAERLLAAGDPAGALEAARSALENHPPREAADRLREIRTRAKRAFLRTAVARAEASAPGMVAEGSAVEVRVRLRNLAPVPLEVPEASGGLSPTTLRLRVTRTARDIFGNARSESWEESHALPPGEAAPGGAVEVAVTVDTSIFRASVPHGYLRYEFGGSILPSGVRVGDLAVHERIPVDPASTLAFPQNGWEDVAADPAAHLERGLEARNPVRVLLAAACLPPEGRGPAAVRLARLLREGAPAETEGAVRAALRALGEDPGADRWSVEAWEARAARGTTTEEER